MSMAFGGVRGISFRFMERIGERDKALGGAYKSLHSMVLHCSFVTDRIPGTSHGSFHALRAAKPVQRLSSSTSQDLRTTALAVL